MLTLARKSMILVAALPLMVGCGGKKKSDSSDGASSSEDAVETTISVELIDNSSELALLAISTFNAKILGCASGLTKDLTQADTTVGLAKNDSGCYFRLSDVSANGKTYTFPASLSAASFGAGVTISTTTDGSTLYYRTVTQLASPLVADPAPAISVQLWFTEGGTATASVVAVSAGIDIDADDPIPLELKSGEDPSAEVDPADGGGLFRFEMDCTGSLTATACDTYQLASIKGRIVKDTYANELSSAECLAAADQSQSDAVAFDATELAGGKLVMVLDGPAPLFGPGNDKLLFALSSTGSQSCKYYRVTVENPL